jgi:hypothetical protein
MTIDAFKTLSLNVVAVRATTEPDASWWSLLRREMIAKGVSMVGDLPAEDVERWYIATTP